MRTRFCATCAWMAAMFLSCGALQAQPRIGVIAIDSAEIAQLLPLVELRLSKDSKVALVERNAINEVLREQQLQAALAADAPGKRVALGKILKADLLVFLAGRDKPKPHAVVVVCETQQGLRLCSERVLLVDRPEADADAVLEQVEAAIKKQGEKITDIVAVPPLVNNSLTHEADNLQVAFARLVERALLRRSGLLVIELAEAKALAREMLLSGTPGIERRLPLYLLGEYRLEGAGASRHAQFTWKLLRGEKELDRREAKDLAVGKLPDRLHQAAMEMIEKALGKSASPCDLEIEARQLAQRARSFIELGAWEEALALAEASLLLKADQVAAHGDALRAMLEINEARECVRQGLGQGLYPPEAIEVIQWLRAALPHLEAFFGGTKVGMEHDWYVHGRWGRFYLRALTPEVRDACLTLRRDMRETAERVLAIKAAAKVADDSLGLLWRWTDPPIEPTGDDAMNFLLRLMGTYSNPARGKWLLAHMPQLCEHRLKLLQDFVWMSGKQINRWNACDELIAIRHLGGWSDPLPLHPAYVEFLATVEKLPNPTMQQWARRCQAEIRPQPQVREERRERSKGQAKTPPRVDRPSPVKDLGVVFHPLTLTESFPNGQETVIASKEPRRQVKEPTAGRTLEAWIPLCEGCDMVYFGREPAWVQEKTGWKVVPVATELALMKEKGRLQALPLKITRSSPQTRQGAMLASTRDELINACWDGQYFWALNPGKDGPLAVVEPREEKIWRSGPEAGLPPSISCGMAPLGHGKVCIAGYFGRLWVALAAFDGKDIKLEVIHEARTVPDVGDRLDDHSPALHSPKLAYPIAFVSTVAAPGGDGRAARQRVVVGRVGAGPLLVDAETRTVTSAPLAMVTAFFLLGREDGVYWQGEDYADVGGGPLYRIGFPDFQRELANPLWHAGVCAFHEGRFHVINALFNRYYVATGLKEPLCRVPCEIPGNCLYPKLFVSHHYGLLLSTEQGIYAVELKKP